MSSLAYAAILLASLAASAPDDLEEQAEPAAGAPAGERAAADGSAGESPEPATADSESRLKFSFRYQPWKDVLDWFAARDVELHRPEVLYARRGPGPDE